RRQPGGRAVVGSRRGTTCQTTATRGMTRARAIRSRRGSSRRTWRSQHWNKQEACGSNVVPFVAEVVATADSQRMEVGQELRARLVLAMEEVIGTVGDATMRLVTGDAVVVVPPVSASCGPSETTDIGQEQGCPAVDGSGLDAGLEPLQVIPEEQAAV